MKKNRVGGVAVDQLKSIIGRVEKLEEEKVAISADIRDIFAEAKGNGFDVKAIRDIIKMRKQDAQEREEHETVLDTYLRAIGMLPELDDDPNPNLFNTATAAAKTKEVSEGTDYEENTQEESGQQFIGNSLEAQASAYT